MRIILSLFILLSPLCINAQSWRTLSNRAEENTNFKKADFVNLLDSISVHVDKNGSGTFFVNKILKINTLKGAVNNNVIKFDYDPLTAFAKFKYVTIHKANGEVKHLDISKAVDYTAPARSIYWGARSIMIGIGRLEPGDVIDYAIDKKGFTYALLQNIEDEERFIPPMRGEFYDIVPFWSDKPTVRKVYKVITSKDKPVQYKFYQGECSSSAIIEGENMIYSFEMEDMLPIKKEPNMVDPFDAAPKLMMSSTPVWKEKSLWFNKVNEDYDAFAPLPEAQKKVDELIKGKKTEMEKIEILTHWVADNIRYSGISMGKGEGFTLHNTKMNYTDRCGVCKDIAGTLISFLRMAGFESYPAMTMAGSRVEEIPADHFNHCVTVVKLSDGTYIPLDPTWVPFVRETWSSAEQQQNYLPGTPEGSDLLETPLSPPENHYFKIDAKSRLDEKGDLNGEMTVRAEGQSDAAMRRMFTLGFMSEWKTSLEQELLAISPEAKLISVKYNKNPKDYQAEPIKITFKYSIPNYALVGDNTMAFKPISMENFYRQVRSFLSINTNLEKRKYGFKDRTSRLVTLNEKIELPKGYKLVSGEKQEKSSSEAADFEGTITQKGRDISLDVSIALKKRVYKAEEWDGFRTAVNMYKSFEEKLIIKK